MLHLSRKFEKFKIEILKIEKDFVEEDGYDKHHYIYLCQKLEGADEISQKFFESTLDELITQQKMEEEEEEEIENDKDEKDEKDEYTEKDKDNIENDGKLTNMGTSVKIEISKKDKKDSKTNVEDNKVISDVL